MSDAWSPLGKSDVKGMAEGDSSFSDQPTSGFSLRGAKGQRRRRQSREKTNKAHPNSGREEKSRGEAVVSLLQPWSACVRLTGETLPHHSESSNSRELVSPGLEGHREEAP